MLQDLNRIPVRESLFGVLSRPQQIFNRAFVVAPLFEMQGEFRNEILRAWSAQALKPLADAAMQLRPHNVRKPPVNGLPVKKVSEFVMRGDDLIGEVVNASRLNKLLAFCEAFAETFNLRRFHVQ